MRWIDCFSTSDPVPNGATFETLPEIPIDNAPNQFSIETCNRRSVSGDHTAYWANLDEFVSIVAAALRLTGVPGLPAMTELDRHWLVSIRKRRRWRVAFLARWWASRPGTQLWKVPVTGGTPEPIGPVPRGFSGSGAAVWLPGDRVVFTTGDSGLLEVSALGGEPRPLLDPDLDVDFHEVSALPDDRGFLFSVHQVGGTTSRIDLFDGRNRRTVLALARGRSGHPPDLRRTSDEPARLDGLVPGQFCLQRHCEERVAFGDAPPSLSGRRVLDGPRQHQPHAQSAGFSAAGVS